MKIDNRMDEDKGTKILARYVREKGVSILLISKKIGISYDKLLRSLSKETRALKLDEFLLICKFLEVDPMRFYAGIENCGWVS